MRATAIRRPCGLALGIALVLASAAPALAETLEMTRDRVDGSTGFTYDAATGTFPPDGTYTSGQILTRGDPVRFFASASPQEGAEVGQRLLGLLSFRLNGNKRAVHYAGSFTFKVTGAEEEVFYRSIQVAEFTLRPKAGQRKKTLSFPFDLPATGFYAVTGRYVGGG